MLLPFVKQMSKAHSCSQWPERNKNAVTGRLIMNLVHALVRACSHQSKPYVVRTSGLDGLGAVDDNAFAGCMSSSSAPSSDTGSSSKSSDMLLSALYKISVRYNVGGLQKRRVILYQACFTAAGATGHQQTTQRYARYTSHTLASASACRASVCNLLWLKSTHTIKH